MRVLELFSGYGSQALALENLDIEFTSDISEIDKYAIQAYNQLHGDTHNWGDITKIDETKLPYYDLITYSSPCQDFSVAGLQRGGDKDSGTRSSLLWECERIIRAVKPKYLLMENVKNLVGEKHKHNFIKWLKVLESIGYKNWWKVLNAKDYGVPQNRERVFVVSILGCGQYLFPNPIKLEKRLKDILENDVDEKYYLNDKWKERIPYQIRLGTSTLDADIIGTQCASQYANYNGAFVSEPVVCASRGRNPDNPSDRTTDSPTEKRIEINTTGCTNTITTVEKDNYLLEPQVVGGIGEKSFGKQYRQGNRIYSSDAISPALVANNGNASGGSVLINEPLLVREPQVLTPKRNEYGKAVRKEYEAGNFTDSRHNMTDMQPRVDSVSNTLTTVQKDNYVIQVGNLINTDSFGGNPQAGRVYSTDGVSPTLNTMQGGQREPKIIQSPHGFNKGNIYGITPSITSTGKYQDNNFIVQNYRIRKLTPLECWRLMGVKDEQFNKLHGISNSQLYKLAGNSIVVDVLMGIFKNLLISDEGTKGQLTLL